MQAKQLAYAQSEADLQRRDKMTTIQAISKEAAEHARAARDQAQAALALAKAQLAAAQAQVRGTTVAEHPEVQQAKVRLREAWIALQRCTIRAPAAGQIAKRSVQIGQQVAPGNALMTLVPLDELWVDANYKEDGSPKIRMLCRRVKPR